MNAPTDLRISSLRIQRFKGIPTPLLLNFIPEHANKPASVILSGDNGTGKSSIVDAIEFALQGRVARKKDFAGFVSSAISASNDYPCEVAVTFTDGTIQKRRIRQDPYGSWHANATPHPRFAASPFVLRRADILQFWNTPDHLRQLFFLDYLRPSQPIPTEWPESVNEKLEALEEDRIRLKAERRELIKQLADHLGIAPAKIPLGKRYESFVQEAVYGHVSKQKTRHQLEKPPNLGHSVPADQLVKKIRGLSKQIKVIETEISGKRGGDAPPKELKTRIRNVLTNVSERITESFSAISASSSFITRIELRYGNPTEVSLSLAVHLSNGAVSPPRNIFSEANLDLLALLIFLAFAQESAQLGQARLLILDDVLQSVDASIRMLVADYILENFSDWQLIFTVHDRLWLEQLRVLLRQKSHPFSEYEIIRWDFESGPVLIGNSRDLDLLLKEALRRGEIISVCSETGLLLEKICNNLSYALPISVTRLRGDRYTLGDLWPGIYKTLNRTNIDTVVEDVNRWLHLRNLTGAHYNEWAQSLSMQESQYFGAAVLALLAKVRCENCARWIERREIISGNAVLWTCRCGKIQIRKT